MSECAACGGYLDPYKRYGKYKDFCSFSCRNAGRAFCKACGIPITQHGVKDFCSEKCTKRYRYTEGEISTSYLEERYRSACKACGKPITQPKCGGKQFCNTLCNRRFYRSQQRGEDITQEWGSYGPETRKILRELQSLRLDGTAKRLAIAIDREYTRHKKGDPNKIKGGYISFLCKNCGKEFRRRPWGHGSKEYCSEKCQPPRYISRKNQPNAIFTWDEVDEIRKIYADGGITYRALGEKYGVYGETIGFIVRYETYKIEDDPRVEGYQRSSKVLSWEEVDNIRKFYSDEDVTITAIAAKYGISRSAIWGIVRYKTWKPENDPRRKQEQST